MRVLTILFLILFGSKAWAADPATEGTLSGLLGTLNSQTQILQDISDTLITMQGGAAPVETDLWLFDVVATDGPGACAMNLYNVSSSRKFFRSSGERRWDIIQPTSGAIAALANLMDLPLGHTLEDEQDFMWQLFLRLNGLPLAFLRPLSADAIHTDCLAANKLVVGTAAYAP